MVQRKRSMMRRLTQEEIQDLPPDQREYAHQIYVHYWESYESSIPDTAATEDDPDAPQDEAAESLAHRNAEHDDFLARRARLREQRPFEFTVKNTLHLVVLADEELALRMGHIANTLRLAMAGLRAEVEDLIGAEMFDGLIGSIEDLGDMSNEFHARAIYDREPAPGCARNAEA